MKAAVSSHLINLVHRIDAGDVHSTPLNHIHKVIYVVVIRTQNVSIHDAVLGAHCLHGVQVNLGIHSSGGKGDATFVLLSVEEHEGGGGGGGISTVTMKR
jgi:hypothetical protein